MFVDKMTIGKALKWYEFGSKEDLYSFVRGPDYDVGTDEDLFCYAFEITIGTNNQYTIEIL